jgi:predicted Zn-dependent protease
MKRFRLAWIILALAVASFPWPCAAQGCKHWTEALAKSFFPHQVDEQGLHSFTNLSLQEYFQFVSQNEEKSFQLESQASYSGQTRLNSALEQFYRVGLQVYGVRLNPDRLAVVPSADVNAFATGSHVFLNAGLMQYFLKPADYVAQIVSAQTGGLTSEQYSALQSSFPWENDWDSIYFILAHEASHNLMRHRDQAVLGRVETMFEDYQQSVTNYRKDVANGRKGGIKRYIWQSMKNFSEELQSAEKQRGEEAEADAVALLLLQRSGFNPGIALAAAEKMDLLLGGGGANGWQAGMTEILCSTHPDWMERIQKTQMNLNCLQSSGNLCENHVAYPVENFLSQLHEGMAQLDSYQEETVRIADGKSSSAQIFQAEVKVDPKDATLQVDGQPVSPGTLQLPVGPHTLSVTRDGYRQQEQQITVFPDVQPKVKIKLKKL